MLFHNISLINHQQLEPAKAGQIHSMFVEATIYEHLHKQKDKAALL